MPSTTQTSQRLIEAARALSDAVDPLRFAPPVTHVYNPLRYAQPMHEQFLTRFGRSRKRVLFLGMNPGPWGMAQTGVPFGEVAAVRDWMNIKHALDAPPQPKDAVTKDNVSAQSLQGHPKRPVQGLECTRSEVSGRRVWDWAKHHFAKPESFFKDHFVTNYCPLVFMEESGKNRTPDKLPADERIPLETACDEHLVRVIEILRPAFIVGIGKFAQTKASLLTQDADLTKPPAVTTILHPSPASPLANRGWAEQATAQLIAAGVWDAQ